MRVFHFPHMYKVFNEQVTWYRIFSVRQILLIILGNYGIYDSIGFDRQGSGNFETR